MNIPDQISPDRISPDRISLDQISAPPAHKALIILLLKKTERIPLVFLDLY